MPRPQHQDPLVWNAFTSEWQNASNPGPSGQPLGVAIGIPGGSAVAMVPEAGYTVLVDGAATGTILAANQYNTAAGTEQVAGFTASVVFNLGAANEQLGMLMVSPLSGGTAQATLQLSESSDSTIPGSTKTGTISTGTTTTWAFTTAHQVLPAQQSIQVAQNFNINATDPRNPGLPEDWHAIAVSGGGMAGSLNYIVIPVGNGSLVALAWFFTHSSGTVTADDTQVCSLPNAYAPASGWRIAAACDQLKTSGGVFEGAHLRILAGNGNVTVWGIGATATFHAGSGVYPLGI